MNRFYSNIKMFVFLFFAMFHNCNLPDLEITTPEELEEKELKELYYVKGDWKRLLLSDRFAKLESNTNDSLTTVFTRGSTFLNNRQITNSTLYKSDRYLHPYISSTEYIEDASISLHFHIPADISLSDAIKIGDYEFELSDSVPRLGGNLLLFQERNVSSNSVWKIDDTSYLKDGNVLFKSFSNSDRHTFEIIRGDTTNIEEFWRSQKQVFYTNPLRFATSYINANYAHRNISVHTYGFDEPVDVLWSNRNNADTLKELKNEVYCVDVNNNIEQLSAQTCVNFTTSNFSSLLASSDFGGAYILDNLNNDLELIDDPEKVRVSLTFSRQTAIEDGADSRLTYQSNDAFFEIINVENKISATGQDYLIVTFRARFWTFLPRIGIRAINIEEMRIPVAN